MDFLRVSGVAKEENGHMILKPVSFTQAAFSRMAVAGETGSGKSTLLKIIAGLVQRNGGEVLFRGENVVGPEEKLMPGHPQIAYLSQHFELRNHYRVEEELDYTNKLSEKEAGDIYDICRISHLLKRWTMQLSGGERQRIALARLLVSSPSLLLLDEPFSNLDILHKEILKSVIRDMSEHLGMTLMLISHDPLDILPWADHILLLKDGAMVQQGAPVQVYRQPVNEYAAGLLGSYNLIRKEKAARFSSLTGIRVVGKSMIIRPENLLVNAGVENFLLGRVKSMKFFGSFYETEIVAQGETLKARTQAGNLTEGEEVRLSVAAGGAWYV
jgi:ABC-type sugar transport system ATPase subunit